MTRGTKAALRKLLVAALALLEEEDDESQEEQETEETDWRPRYLGEEPPATTEG